MHYRSDETKGDREQPQDWPADEYQKREGPAQCEQDCEQDQREERFHEMEASGALEHGGSQRSFRFLNLWLSRVLPVLRTYAWMRLVMGANVRGCP
jgi:hypothetical protein